MEALSFQSLLQLPSTLRTPSYVEKEQPKNTVAKNLGERLHSPTAKRLPRRLLLQFMGFCPILSHPVFAAPTPEMKEPQVIRTLKLPSGVRIQEIVEGQGSAANEGDLVEINYVCRRTNGYFVHSTVDQFSGESTPVILPLDEKQIIAGLKEVLVGMRIGGKRRALIPPYVGYINENLKPIPEEFGPRRSLLSHVNEPLIFEFEALSGVEGDRALVTKNTALTAALNAQFLIQIGIFTAFLKILGFILEQGFHKRQLGFDQILST